MVKSSAVTNRFGRSPFKPMQEHIGVASRCAALVPDLFEAYCRSTTPVILPDFLGALSVMLAKGILVDRQAGGPTPR